VAIPKKYHKTGAKVNRFHKSIYEMLGNLVLFGRGRARMVTDKSQLKRRFAAENAKDAEGVGGSWEDGKIGGWEKV
jgi:hypothetical protein